jgi:iron complex transport system ATP-binding protein
MKPITIEIEDLSTGYVEKKGIKLVAQHLQASIHSGELTCLLGANGAGKSTLLRTLSAFQPAMAGTVRLLGKPLSSYSDAALARIVGVVLTEKCEVRNMSVFDLVSMGRSPYTGFWGKLRASDEEKVREALMLVGIEALAQRMVHTLSDGERQKVMVAKALAQETPIIFLDEPTAYLDFPSKVEMMQLLHRLSRTQGKTIFLSTHDLDLALQIADKVWLMDRENGLATGTPEDLSLSGNLSNFFARKGIAFDEESGLFRIESQFHAQLQLNGCGRKYAMIRKALQRNGIYANRHVVSPCSITVSVDSREFRLHFPSEQEECIVTTIEALLELVEQHVGELSPFAREQK